jgi:hypothetical protein
MGYLTFTSLVDSTTKCNALDKFTQINLYWSIILESDAVVYSSDVYRSFSYKRYCKENNSIVLLHMNTICCTY